MIHYGGDYNPEQWPEDIWPDDIEHMKRAGVTMVSIGIFSWARIQKAEDEFDFGWLDRIIDLLHAAGIRVDLATATASPPPWLTHRYPEVLPADVTGATLGIGSRQAYSPSSPVYRRLASELVKAIAERYVDHPAIEMWHINNEYGCHLNLDYSEAAADGFRQWLQAKYGDIASLNDAWGTAFWSQIYTSFDEIRAPRIAPYSHNPSQLLDYRRYYSDALLECYLMEKQILLDAGATQPITTNFMGGFKPADYWKWAPHVDIVSDDSYPDPNEDDSHRASAFGRDLMRSLKPQTPWLLMEQATNALNWRPSNAPKAPGQMTATSMQAVAKGADGVLFFQWRQGRSGAEKFHSAMLPQVGTRSRTWREVEALGATLAEHETAPLVVDDSATDDSAVAIVLDWNNWWAVEGPDHPRVVDYLESVLEWHAGLHRRNVQIDIVNPTSDLSPYGAVIAPHLYLLTTDGAANLTDYVEGGGTLLVTCFSDIVDENERFRPGGYATQLGPLCGVWVEDFGALVDEGEVGQSVAPFALEGMGGGGGDGDVGVTVTGLRFAEEIHADDADVVGRFVGGRRDGDPALTRRRVAGLRAGTDAAAGTAWYLATVPDSRGIDHVLELVLADTGVEPIVAGLPASVEASVRSSDVYLINHSGEQATVSATSLAPFGEPERTLGPWEWMRVRRDG